jgi:tetratricopeptide (TPR) repeat protein
MTKSSAIVSLVLSAAALAQNPNQLQSTFISIPKASQHASISQRIALTDVTIVYHRPVALDRKVFGGIVPYEQVWRAGANDNTTIQFSTPVKIEDQPLPAGAYGLHMIPNADEWTIIFSKNSTSWGSFTYDEKEDALRVKVKPSSVEMRDTLSYDFESLKPESAVVTLRWERVAVPFRVSVDRIATTLDSLHKELRFTAQYTWEGLNDAASWCLENKVNYDEALKWVNQSVQGEERFENLDTKAKLLQAMGRPDEAAKVQARLLETANAVQLFRYARGMQREGKVQKAFAQYRANAKRFPDHWATHLGNARMLSAEKNFDGAAKEMRAAIASTADNKPQAQALEGLLKRLEAKDDINK